MREGCSEISKAAFRTRSPLRKVKEPYFGEPVAALLDLVMGRQQKRGSSHDDLPFNQSWL